MRVKKLILTLKQIETKDAPQSYVEMTNFGHMKITHNFSYFCTKKKKIQGKGEKASYKN